MTLQDLLAVPELDEWDYLDSKKFTSAEFIVHAFKHLGLFDGVEVNAAEFTPKDVY